MASLTVYERDDGRWRWRLEADNGQIVATNGGVYDDEATCWFMASEIVLTGGFADAELIVEGLG
jgi:hypothetical protein